MQKSKKMLNVCTILHAACPSIRHQPWVHSAVHVNWCVSSSRSNVKISCAALWTVNSLRQTSRLASLGLSRGFFLSPCSYLLISCNVLNIIASSPVWYMRHRGGSTFVLFVSVFELQQSLSFAALLSDLSIHLFGEEVWYLRLWTLNAWLSTLVLYYFPCF